MKIIKEKSEFRIKKMRDGTFSIYDSHGELVDYGYKTRRSAEDYVKDYEKIYVTKKESVLSNTSKDTKVVKEGVSSSFIFKNMKRVNMTDSEWEKARKSGKYVTDGYGRVYELPTEGYSEEYEYDDKTFRYNYGKKRLEWISNNGKVIDSTILSPVSFVENPVYWFETYYDELEYERL